MFSKKHTIAFVTTSRADFGLLYPIINRLNYSSYFKVKLLVSGSHLSSDHGFTVNEIRGLGCEPDLEIPIFLGNDTGLDISSTISDAIFKFANAFNQLQPDIIFILGDRAEIFAVAQAAVFMHIPIAHYFGGDSASGTYDNLFRHCITKLSALHFVSSEESMKRVLQLGEDEKNIFLVGSTAVENVKSYVNNDDFFLAKLGIKKVGPLFLVTYHPLTMGVSDFLCELELLLSSLIRLTAKKDFTLVFTAANGDEGGAKINKLIRSFVDKNPCCYFFDSLGMENYLNLMSRADVVIGNSSSGIYEAPILGVPSVDIGERQKGRFTALRSVIRSPVTVEGILDSIELALAVDRDSITHCFGNGNSADEIVAILEGFKNFRALTTKSFHDFYQKSSHEK
jgi:UDP-hydrolysing UDP-N-acetyl-D-glucosamine 2-epimerase